VYSLYNKDNSDDSTDLLTCHKKASVSCVGHSNRIGAANLNGTTPVPEQCTEKTVFSM